MKEKTTALRNRDKEKVEGHIEESWVVPVYGCDTKMERGFFRTAWDGLLVVWRWKRPDQQWRVDEG